jgi:RNA polymerase sigma factor (sigma-70 family)
MLRAGYAITLDLEVARENTNEAFLRLWERRDKLASHPDPKAWLMRVAVNLAISHRRWMFGRLRHHPIPVRPDPEDLALLRIQSGTMREALLTLKPRERAVLALRYQQDLAFAQIALLLGCPEATVRTWCHRALETLRTQMGGVQNGTPLLEEAR